MLPTELVHEIDRLLRAGELSHRKIADHLCVSRGTISAIASGRRCLYGREPLEVHSPLVPSSSPVRCPHCGYRVYLPCLICRLKELKQRQRLLHLLAAKRPKNVAVVASSPYRTQHNRTDSRAPAQVICALHTQGAQSPAR